MDKLINDFNRGFNLKNNDLRFVEAAVRLTISDIINFIKPNAPFRLWGCAVTEHGSYISVSEGAIYWEGEVWHVFAHNLAVATPLVAPVYWVFVTEYDPAGVKLDKDLVSHDTYQVRKAKSSLTTNPDGAIGYIILNEGTAEAGTYPACPTGLYTYKDSAYESFYWLPNLDDTHITSYEIWKGIDTIVPTLLTTVPATTLGYNIEPPEVGSMMVIYIRAVNSAGYKSKFSQPLFIDINL